MPAFEVTKSDKIFTNTLNGLKSFLNDYPDAKAYLVYGGTRKMYEGNIEILPVADALRKTPV